MLRYLIILAVACGGAADPAPSDPFWKWFVANADSIAHQTSLVEALDRMQTELAKSHPGVLVEMAAGNGTHTLVVTADGEKKLFPEIQKLVAAKPTVAGWTIVAFRQRDVKRPMTKLSIDGAEIEPSQLRFTSVAREGKLDVELFLPGSSKADKTLAFLALDHCLGEYDVEMKIGRITLSPTDHAPASAASLDELPRAVDALR